MDLSVVPLTHDKTLSMVFLPAGLLDGDVFFETDLDRRSRDVGPEEMERFYDEVRFV